MAYVQVGGSYHLPPPAPGLDPGQPRSEAEWVEIVQKTAEQLGDQKGQPASWQQGLVRAFQVSSMWLCWSTCWDRELELLWLNDLTHTADILELKFNESNHLRA